MKPNYRLVTFAAVVAVLIGFLLWAATAARATEPTRCGTMWYTWYGTTALVDDYVEEPGLSITIVGHHLWAQNTAEPASSTQHLTSVELTKGSPNPYTICVGDTTYEGSTPSQPAAPTTSPATVQHARSSDTYLANCAVPRPRPLSTIVCL